MGHLILIRHATTDASQEGRNLGQSSNPPLAPAGAALATRLGETLVLELAELPVAELRIVTSSALRCRQTAGAVARAIDGAPDPEVEPGLLEINYGAWEGLTPQECEARDPELRRAWEADPFATATPSGESGADVAARAFPVFEGIEAWLRADRARCAIVVAHNHVNRLRLTALMGWPMADYRRRITQDPGGYSVVSFGAELPLVRRVNAPPVIADS
jgi:broad specificity phosphatase PhoE